MCLQANRTMLFVFVKTKLPVLRILRVTVLVVNKNITVARRIRTHRQKRKNRLTKKQCLRCLEGVGMFQTKYLLRACMHNQDINDNLRYHLVRLYSMQSSVLS